ncbi:MAG: hypothetical protein IJQ16_03260 [Selenomonadaceae bacterium]|nr:hypothetical protein [Selenomonadaceae bacterium]
MRIKKVPVKVAALILGKAEQFVRCGLAYGKLPFGVAVTTNPNKKPRPYYSYHISAEKFKDYTGCTDEKIIECAKKLGCDLQIDED